MELALEAADYAGFDARREASRRAGKLRGIAVVNAIEQAAGPLPEYAEIRFQPSGTRDHADGHQDPWPGPRDLVQADPARTARHRTRRCAVHRWRHRPRGVRHGVERLALDGDRRHGADPRRGQGDRQGQADRRPHAGSRRGRHRVRRREIHRCRHRSRRHAEAGGDRRVPAGAAAAGHGSRACIENATYAPKRDTFPNGCHVCRGRSRSRNRRGRTAVLSRG